MVTDKVIIAGKRCMLVMCNNVLNLLCNVSVFIDDEDDDVLEHLNPFEIQTFKSKQYD